MTRFFSLDRFRAVAGKEFVQMRRDRLTFAMMLGIPLLQILLFGYAINSDPKHLPTAVLSGDNSPFSRAVVTAMQASGYFRVTLHASSREQVRRLLDTGQVQFAVTFPQDFGKDLVRGERPVLLVEADATDPGATSNAAAALPRILDRALSRELNGALTPRSGPAPPPAVELRLHPDFNPEAVTQYNIVPGLMGVVLTMTLVIITSLAVTRERERGTMEYLLSTPVKPLEVILGKIMPYILVGYIQVLLILAVAWLLFDVPMHGSILLLLTLSLVFITANLCVGVTFSTLAANQLQAIQLSIFFFLPSLLLSGFMFPFRGMPVWAQYIGEILPLTHYLRFVRGVLLKGLGLEESLLLIWPVALFMVAAVAVAVVRYRRTLD